MPDNSNNPINFWQELKRRKVLRVITVYAAVAFVILQLVEILAPSLRLPDWTMNFILVILIVGFIIAIILSWIYDIHPEGGIVKTESLKEAVNNEKQTSSTGWKIATFASVVIIITFVVFYLVGNNKKSFDISMLEKSIAVLPLEYLSEDPNKQYLANGVLDAITGHLSKIEGLRVMPRTSVEQYRETIKAASEIGEELNVSYLIEGSFLMVEDQVKITIQLVVAKEEDHVFFKEFDRNYEDIIIVQSEVAQTIAKEIEVAITPEEKELIEKIPTSNPTAYDYYLKGSELLNKQYKDNLSPDRKKDLKDAIKYFIQALEHDDRFALVYAELAVVYFQLDNFPSEQEYSDQISKNADMAMLYDPQLDMSYIAKAYYYRNQEEFELAVTYLEKALDFNPNSYLALAGLRSLYSWTLTNAELRLKYALKLLKLNIATSDTINRSAEYAALGTAYRQLGFFKEAEEYLNMSLEIDPSNSYALNTKAFLFQDMEKDYQQQIDFAISAYNNDSTNSNILRALFLIFYEKRDYNNALKYHYKLIENNSIFLSNAGRVSHIFSLLGKLELSEEYMDRFFNYCENMTNFYKYHRLAGAYSFIGDTQNALEQMKIFSKQENYSYWVLRNYNKDPLYDNIRDLPEFQEILTEMEIKFWENNERIKASLVEDDLL